MADVDKVQALALVALDLHVVQVDLLDVLGVDGQLLHQRAVVGHGGLTGLGVGVKAPFVINMFYFCDPDGHGPYVQCREAMPVDEYTPKLGSLTMENIVATDAQFAGCYFDGLPEQPIERVTMRDVSITFDPNAKEGQAAMADNRPLVKKLAIYAENVKEIDLHNVKIEGYEGERLHFANVGHFEED